MVSRYSALLTACLMLSACSAPLVKKSAPVDPTIGYVYGALRLPPSDRICDLRAGLVLTEIGTKGEHFLELSRSEAVSVFPIPPGRYEIKYVGYKTCEGGMESSRKELTSPLIAGEIEVKPLTALYIGHYEGQTNAFYNGFTITQRWSMRRICRDFATTTAQFQTGWPNLSRLPTIDATTGGAPC